MKRLLGLFGIVLLALAALAAALPARVVVERSITVGRPASTVFTLFNGLVSWSAWSPWVLRDPSVAMTRSGPERGPGLRLAWSGDPGKSGLGALEILDSSPSERVQLRLRQGGQQEALLEYEIEGDALGSQVTWIYEADSTAGKGFAGRIVGRYYGWFLARWVAADFELGLQRFKAVAESLPAADFSQAEITRVEARPQRVARVTGLGAATPEKVAEVLAGAFADLSAWAVDHGVEFQGQPLTIAERRADGTETYQAAVPVSVTAEAPQTDRVGLGQTPSGDAVCVLHRGSPLESLGSYEQLDAWVRAHGLQATGVSWEHYLSDPASASPGAASMEICSLVAPAATHAR
ncbi:MAG: SRPBCC family protein [Xanthomonadales bacterium]|nr:SRPBCC family protein [Xanthomonadales bacterium]